MNAPKKPPHKLSPKARAQLRRASTMSQTKYGIGGKEKTGQFAPKPINLRRPKP